MPLEVLGVDHIDLTVNDVARSTAFYDKVLAELLVRVGVTVLDAPAEYPQCAPDYYAVFFADPDGMKLELVSFPWGYWRKLMTEGKDWRPRYVGR